MIYLKKSLYLPLLPLFLLASCSKNHDLPDLDPVAGPPSSAVSSTINSPAAINLMVETKNSIPYRLVMPILKIGSTSVNLKTVFDTGSQGLILDAHNFLPAEIITDDGIVMNGKSSIVVNDITITSVKDVARYGNTKDVSRTYYGNIAYSTVVLGDENGNLTTRKMPFLLIYKGVNDASQQAVKIDKVYDGICGVSSSYVSNNDLAASRKELKSPFDYMNYSQGVNAGFMLAPLGQDDINGDGLFVEPGLTIGVTDNLEKDFVRYGQDLSNTTGTYFPTVPVSVKWNDQNIQTRMLFDTGTPFSTYLLDPKFTSQERLPDQTNVEFDKPKFTYSYTIANGLNPTFSGPGTRSTVGLSFFNAYYYLLDYQKHYICFLSF